MAGWVKPDHQQLWDCCAPATTPRPAPHIDAGLAVGAGEVGRLGAVAGVGAVAVRARAAVLAGVAGAVL